jgi:peptide/nickel transport system substrate-binding protein
MWRNLRRRTEAAALGLLLLAAACTTDGKGAHSSPGPSLERPAAHGTLRIAYPEEPATLNPIRARSAAERDLLRPLLPSFFRITPELAYEPYLLAEEPTVRVTGQEMLVDFRIRDDAAWSDGTPITVDDVVFTWRVMSDPVLPVEVRDGFEYVQSIRPRSERDGQLILSPPYAAWRDLFAAGRFVLPAHAATRRGEVRTWDAGPPVTAGPFLLEERVRGRSVTLVPDPLFFGPDPLVDRIEVLFVPDPTTAAQLLAAGRVDAVAPTLGVAWRHRLSEIKGTQTSSVYGPNLVHLLINAETVTDASERRAIGEAIDRGRFADVLLGDEARVADGVLSPEQDGFIPAWERYGDGTIGPLPERELLLAYPQTELVALAARHVLSQLRLSGGDVELVGLDPQIFHDEWLPERRFDLAIWESRGGPGPWLDRWFGSEGDESLVGLRDPRLDELLARAREGAEVATAPLAAAQSRIAKLAPILPLFQPLVTAGWRQGVSGLLANPSADGIFWNAWEWSVAPAGEMAA